MLPRSWFEFWPVPNADLLAGDHEIPFDAMYADIRNEGYGVRMHKATCFLAQPHMREHLLLVCSMGIPLAALALKVLKLETKSEFMKQQGSCPTSGAHLFGEE